MHRNFWNSLSRLICRFDSQEHSSAFKVCFQNSKYPIFYLYGDWWVVSSDSECEIQVLNLFQTLYWFTNVIKRKEVFGISYCGTGKKWLYILWYTSKSTMDFGVRKVFSKSPGLQNDQGILALSTTNTSSLWDKIPLPLYLI